MLRRKNQRGCIELTSDEKKVQKLLRACRTPVCRLAVRALSVINTEAYLYAIVRKELGEIEEWQSRKAAWNAYRYKQRGRDWTKK